jgi:hypothetical protein
MLAVIFITSCLGNSNQKITIANQPGVVIKSGNDVKVQLSDNISIYSDRLTSGIDDGDCLLLKYTLDYGLDANSDSGRTAGFFTVDLVEANGLPQYDIKNEIDTVNMFGNERLITTIQQRHAFILDRLFLYTQHQVDSFRLQNFFEIAYNAKSEPQVTNNRRIYNLYLRVFRNTEVEEQKTNNPESIFINVFNLSSIAQKEKALGNDSLLLKIRYVRSFNKDTTAVTNWAETDLNLSLYPQRK